MDNGWLDPGGEIRAPKANETKEFAARRDVGETQVVECASFGGQHKTEHQ